MEYPNRFLQCLQATLRHEAGYSNNPADPGGETNFGITATTLQRAIASKIVAPGLTVRDLQTEHINAIYFHLFWTPAACANLPAPLDFSIFDFYVNSGNAAIRTLQQLVATPADGTWGANSQKALQAKLETTTAFDLALNIEVYRLQRFTELRGWLDFGRGWTRRSINNILNILHKAV